jgi:hypothetical protein
LRLSTSVFSKDPYGEVGIQIISPVKVVLKASIAAVAVSESPTTTNFLGSTLERLRNFFWMKAGI